MKVKFVCEQPRNVVEEALWLAWQACGGPSGMGILRDRPSATKQDVLNNVTVKEDYPGYPGSSGIDADYVFGRMIKLRCDIAEDGILYPDSPPRFDYQAWCKVYPTYESLFSAALTNLREM